MGLCGLRDSFTFLHLRVGGLCLANVQADLASFRRAFAELRIERQISALYFSARRRVWGTIPRHTSNATSTVHAT